MNGPLTRALSRLLAIWLCLGMPVMATADGADHHEGAGGHDASPQPAKEQPAGGHGGEGKSANEHVTPVIPMPGPPSDLSATVRAMQRLQDRMAAGDRGAQGLQTDVLSDAGQLMLELGADLCASRENRRAVLLVLFNGGNPQWARACLLDKTLSEQDRHLLRGAIAFVIGRTKNAKEELANIDPLLLDPSVGAQVALVRASLTLADDRTLGLRLLDLARLLQPGGLAEEAALRQEVFALGSNGDIDKFALLSRQYIQRFSKSLFAENFIEGFVRGVIDLGLAADDERFAKLSTAIDLLTPEAAASTYLLIARRGLLDGTFGATRRAAASARRILPATAPDLARVKLYTAAADIAGPNSKAAQVQIEKMDPAQLPRRDQRLREAALQMARAVHRPPIPLMPGLPQPVLESASLKALSTARNSLATADNLIGTP